MKKLILLLLFTCGIATAQTASNTITVNGTNYLVVEGRVDVGCVGELTPVPLQLWEHTVIGAGFTSSGTNRLYSRVDGITTITIDLFGSLFEVVISDTNGRFEPREQQTLAQVIELIYEGR